MPTEKPQNLAEALAQFQADLPKIDKSKTGKVEGTNAQGKSFSYTYTYAGLAEIEHEAMPLLGALGLSFSARPTLNAAGRFVLVYVLMHACGESVEGEYPLGDPKTPQAAGSAITYARRYAFCAVTGIVAEDDDDGAEATRSARTSNRGNRRTDPTSERVERDHAAALAGPGPGDEDDWPESAKPGGGASQNENRRRALMAEFSRAGMPYTTHRDQCLRGAEAVVGHPVASVKDLTPAEVEAVLKALKQRRPAQPAGALAPEPGLNDWPDTAQPGGE